MLEVVIKADGALTERSVKKVPDLRALQAHVGGLIQEIPDLRTYRGRRVQVAYCNEEGLLKGLPHNPAATNVWRASLDAAGRLYSRASASLVGDVVLYVRGK